MTTQKSYRYAGWLLAGVAACNTDKPPPAPPLAAAPPSAAVAPAAAASPAPQASASTLAPQPSASVAPSLPPVSFNVPPSVADKAPFVLYLHGLGATGAGLAKALSVDAVARERKFSWAAPDGDLNSKGQRFWNASKACCNLDGSTVSHVERLGALLAAAASHPKVDPKRMYVVGFSNGGFMAHRLACEVSSVAAVVSIAGAGPAEGEPCAPSHPVAVLQLHGDADEVIRYEGGSALGRVTLPRHPSARQSVDGWAARNGCKGGMVQAGSLDLEDKLEGAETWVGRFGGCSRPVELWTVRGGSHFIAMGRRAHEHALAFLEKATLP